MRVCRGVVVSHHVPRLALTSADSTWDGGIEWVKCNKVRMCYQNSHAIDAKQMALPYIYGVLVVEDEPLKYGSSPWTENQEDGCVALDAV